MDQAKLTSKKVIQRKLFPSRRNHPKKPQKLALAVMPEKKNTTTSVAASIGATTLAAQIAIRRTLKYLSEAIRDQIHCCPNQSDEIVISWPQTCCEEVNRNSVSVVTARQRLNSADLFITRCWKV